jgi:hypothetical protein
MDLWRLDRVLGTAAAIERGLIPLGHRQAGPGPSSVLRLLGTSSDVATGLKLDDDFDEAAKSSFFTPQGFCGSRRMCCSPLTVCVSSRRPGQGRCPGIVLVVSHAGTQRVTRTG